MLGTKNIRRLATARWLIGEVLRDLKPAHPNREALLALAFDIYQIDTQTKEGSHLCKVDLDAYESGQPRENGDDG